jgi:F-type H+-transporting ATPase subunit alpha
MGKYVEDLVTGKLNEIYSGANRYEVGRIMSIREYILEVSGLENVRFYERVKVAGESEGYVISIRRNSVMVALVKRRGDIYVGDEVIATGEEFCLNYADDAIGHVVNMFGEDVLTGKMLEKRVAMHIENPTTPIMDRTSVNRPLETGIAGIDLIYPIGRGQRQLIIGDKKTGKTQIALDAILNQKGKDVICIYIAVGKTKKNVKEVYTELANKGAMKYTILLAALNNELPPVLSLTPYAGLAIAEKYMLMGKDVLVIIDDLSRHADCYREISLLIGKVPGRDAYPPDIFYTHSRLLEKGCQHKSGGSITILPIVETRGGDITDYISTNIISITDGQIVLSKKSFDKGEKPAINYGLSVSRLGGAVQTGPMKKLGAQVRRELLSYLETREVYELANTDEMGKELQDRLLHGSKLLKALGQYKYSPLSQKEIIEKFEAVYRGE